MSHLSVSAAPSQPLLETRQAIIFEDVTIGFDDKQVLDGISFQLQRGESKILLGVSGAGKSTILKLVLGLIKPDRGRISVLGHEITRMKEEELFEVRRKLGMVFQESALFDSLTVRENVSYPLTEEQQDIPQAEIKRRVREALQFVDLEDTLDKMPAELSGGMRRRVAIARAIVGRPEIMLYDSPTAGLDPVTSTTIIELIVKQRDVYRTTSLMVTHRLQDAYILATHHFDSKANQMRLIQPGDTINVHTTFLLLREGRIIFDGIAPDMVRSHDAYIREYIS